MPEIKLIFFLHLFHLQLKQGKCESGISPILPRFFGFICKVRISVQWEWWPFANLRLTEVTWTNNLLESAPDTWTETEIKFQKMFYSCLTFQIVLETCLYTAIWNIPLGIILYLTSEKWLSGCQLLFTNYIFLQNAVDFTLLLWPQQRKFLAIVQSFIQVHTLTCLCNDEVLVTWGTKLNQSKIIVM